MAQGMSTETANHYIRSLRGFTGWLERSDRIRRNPLKGLRLFNSEIDIRHARRELTEDELIRLLEGTRQSKRIYRGLTGEDRACLYLAATVTGFRARAVGESQAVRLRSPQRHAHGCLGSQIQQIKEAEDPVPYSRSSSCFGPVSPP